MDDIFRPVRRYDFTEAVTFRPWIGKDYGEHSRFGIPLLIMGDSHYGGDSDFYTGFTTKVTLEHRCSHRFWQSITRACSDHDDISKEDSTALWDSIAFYNYCQTGLTNSYIPTREMYLRSIPAFREVLAVLRPKCIVVVCERTWNRLPDGSELERQGENIRIPGAGAERTTWLYSIGSGDFAHTSRIPHPSMRRVWNASTWRPWVKAAIEAAGGSFPQRG
jgi:hypothetical protein